MLWNSARLALTIGCLAWIGFADSESARADETQPEPPAPAARLNGFRLEPSLIPAEEILRGGPPRDGIPALDHPTARSAASSSWRGDTRVVGISIGGESRAYPVAILVWHELVNDTLGGHPILVSYCPLCGTAMVFDRRGPGRSEEPSTFGVSGLLYRSDLLMFDRQSESLWSQIAARALVGSRAGDRLDLLRSRLQRWDDWRRDHPASTILARETGVARDYDRSPYGDYAQSEQLLFPVEFDRRHHPKMPTLGVRLGESLQRAYPASEVVKAGGRVSEELAGRPVSVSWNVERGEFDATVPDEFEVVEGYWFAWISFHPRSSVFRAAVKP